MPTPPDAPVAPTVADLIARKRDGIAWSEAAIQRLVRGLSARRGAERLSDAQAGALAMAVVWRGLSMDETVALTLAMRDSGRVLRWPQLDGPVLDKHSTGGVGDTVSLMLGPLLAAAGAFVPMVSGRSLGHTGGTLDKLESIPGYQVQPGLPTLRRVVRQAGVAIVAAGSDLAPADRRLYAVRDVTATVESAPLIVASILSKKLSAGLQGLVMDVKTGPGAFLPDPVQARSLARLLVQVGQGAGLPVRACLTPMDQPLGPAAGNALEMRLALDYLSGRCRPSRLHDVTLALASEALVLGGVQPDLASASRRLLALLESGAAAERLARMVAGLGGPTDLVEHPDRHLAVAPVQLPVIWSGAAGTLCAIDTRALGWTVLRLGGGRQRDGDAVDSRVGLSGLASLGDHLESGQPIATVHAASADAAHHAAMAVHEAFTVGGHAAEVHRFERLEPEPGNTR